MRLLWLALLLSLSLMVITACESSDSDGAPVLEDPVTNPDEVDVTEPSTPPAANTCVDRCGAQDEAAPCQCDADCLARKDCCKGICGVCGDVEALAPVCTPCAPVCGDKECGDDGCGGACGVCEGGTTCDDEGLCVQTCVPQCADKACGTDGCGGSCGGCDTGLTCHSSGACVETCASDCVDKMCGDDGCGSLCGTCPLTAFCTAVGVCESLCEADCDGKVCGDDGCGGACGQDCSTGLVCVTGACVDETICCEVMACPEGWACDGATCGCDLPCCTSDFCDQTGESCDKLSCDCVEKVCCTDQECAGQGLACNTDSCACEQQTLGQDCVAFQEDFCFPGQWCQPTKLDFAGSMLGTCQPIEGELSEGAFCGGMGMGGMGGMMGACGPGLGCVGTQGGMSECMTYCNPGAAVGAPGGCDFGEGCVIFPLTDATGAIAGVPDFGFCRPSCVPFVAQEDSGCDNIEWCSPDLFSAQTGQCGDGSGTAEDGDLCGSNTDTPETTCGPGLLCVNMNGETSCNVLCIPGAQDGEPGDTCPDGAACGSLSVSNADGSTVPLAIGSCVPSCGFHEDIPCEDENLSCSPGEIFDMTEDRCIKPNPQFSEWPMPEFALCPPGVQPGLLCGPSQACMDIPPEMEPADLSGDGVRCHDLCVLSENPMMMMGGHPDCRRDTAQCLDVFGTLPYGLCGADMVGFPTPP